MQTINATAYYPEGPLWRNSQLYYVECSEHRVMRWNGADNAVFWHEHGSGACALAAWDDDLLLCAYDGNAMIRIGPDGRTIARHNRDVDGAAFVGPNDLTPDGAGGFFFTASGIFDLAAPAAGAVMHVDRDFRIRRLADGLHYANGIVFDAAQHRLFVAETLARRIVVYDVADDAIECGRLDAPRLFCRLPELAAGHWPDDPWAGGDGMKLDGKGRLLVACFGAGCLLAVEPDGTRAKRIEIPLRYPTNIALDPSTGAAAVTAVADPWHAPFPGAVFHLAPDLIG